MGYDREAADRLQRIAAQGKGISSRNMFGGVCHLLNGRIFCGLSQGYLFLRLGEKGASEALRSPLVRPFDIAGRLMKGWVMVAPEAWDDDEKLAAWIDEAIMFVATLQKD